MIPSQKPKGSTLIGQKRRKIHLIVFIASVLVTTIFLTLLPEAWNQNESSDYVGYYEPLARNILAGNGYTRSGNAIETFYPPGYPLILASQFAIAESFTVPESVVLQLFLVLFAALSVLFVFDLARRFGDTKSGLISAIVWMTYPFFLWLTKQPNSELAFMVILFAACDLFFTIYYFLDKKPLLMIPAGLLFGLGMLVRPIAVFYPAVLILLIWITQKAVRSVTKLRVTFLFLTGVMIAVLPWELFTYMNTGKVPLISSNDAATMRGGFVFAVSDAAYKQEVTVPADVKNLMLEIKENYANLDSTSKIVRFLGSRFREKPMTVIKLIGLKALRSWYATDSQRLEKTILILQIPYLALIIIGSWFSWRKGGVARNLLIGIWLLTLCNWFMTMAATSTLRYMVPVIGLLFIPAGQIPLLQKIVILFFTKLDRQVTSA